MIIDAILQTLYSTQIISATEYRKLKLSSYLYISLKKERTRFTLFVRRSAKILQELKVNAISIRFNFTTARPINKR